MLSDWHLIYSSQYLHQAEFYKAVLEDFGIQAVVINKKDSAYLFGEVELYVQSDDVINAKQIINKEIL
ncbi:MAG TPA: hypothetical protein DCM62_08250 [Bacteroidales bacterium]|nr:hypothetical protein [Bacteroidales bacterium]